MTAPHGERPAISRRDFVRWGSLGGAALVLGVSPSGEIIAPRRKGRAADLAPNQWITIDAAGAVTIVAARSEMGQGVRTALPMIAAEELGADWHRVVVRQARPGVDFPDTNTSGSSSIPDMWHELRRAAAAAREMLISAAAAEWRVDRATCVVDGHAVIHPPTQRHLGFGSLAAAAAALPVPGDPPLKPSSAYRLLGTRVPRVDAPAIVTGRAIYGLDAKPPGTAVGVVARPPQHGAKVARWNAEAARRVPGVIDVMQISTGVAVLADRTWAAIRGRDALQMEWTEQANVLPSEKDYREALEAALGRGRTARREGGDVDAALASADRRMEGTYSMPFQAHAAIEPLNCYADVREDRCEIRVGTQSPSAALERVAEVLGIPRERITIDVALLGGGFGRRIERDYIVEAVEVSRAARRPVQVVWTREDDMRHDRYNPAQANRIIAGLDASGMPVAWRHQTADYHLTMFGDYDPSFDPASSGDPWGGFDTPYAFPALDVTLALLESPVPTGAWRAVSYPAAVFARECFLDEVAHATGRDPAALRLALIPSPGMFRGSSGQRPNGDRLRRVLTLAAERAGWGAPLPATRDGRRLGRGIACNEYHRGAMVAQVADVSVGAAGDLRVERIVCAVDCGRVINLAGVEGQVESGIAWALSALDTEIGFDRGRTRQSNFSDYPVLRHTEMPAVEVHVVSNDFGPFGVGEPPVPPVIPAVMNAVFAATGRRIRHLPLRPRDLAL
jgi:isoquinoline 1-oxidoreductase subunit beta